MEGLTFAADPNLLYVGDEYNYIYELNLETGEIVREWNLADVGVSTNVDKGIEALTYDLATGYFYAGIHVLDGPRPAKRGRHRYAGRYVPTGAGLGTQRPVCP